MVLNKKIPNYERRKIKDIKDMVLSSVEIFKDKPAFWVKQKGKDGYQPISYNQLKIDMNALGTALIDMELKGKKSQSLVKTDMNGLYPILQ